MERGLSRSHAPICRPPTSLAFWSVSGSPSREYSNPHCSSDFGNLPHFGYDTVAFNGFSHEFQWLLCANDFFPQQGTALAAARLVAKLSPQSLSLAYNTDVPD